MDDISKMFEDINPNDFQRETSARDDSAYGVNDYQGQQRFDGWVGQLLEATRIAFEASDGQMAPFAILHRPDRRRIYVAEEDETVEMFVNRLHREAVEFEPIWFYLAMLAPSGYSEEGHVPIFDEENIHTVDAYLSEGVLDLNVNWYAEAREPDFRSLRYGVFVVENGRARTLLEDNSGSPEGSSYLFRRVLP